MKTKYFYIGILIGLILIILSLAWLFSEIFVNGNKIVCIKSESNNNQVSSIRCEKEADK